MKGFSVWFKAQIFIISLMSFAWLASPASADSGSYLAATQADINDDFEDAAYYYAQVIIDQPDNPALMEAALFSFLAKNSMEEAVAIAKRLIDLQSDNALATLVIVADYVHRGDFEMAKEVLGDNLTKLGEVVDGLVRGWVEAGYGSYSEAINVFDSLSAGSAPSVLGQYQKAIALALAGDFSGADKILTGDENGTLRLNRNSVIAHIEIMAQLEKNEDALDLINQLLNGGSVDAEVIALRDAIEAGEGVEFSKFKSASDGLAEAFYTLADAYNQEESYRFALLYGRLSDYVRPEHSDTLMLVGEIYSQIEQYKLAIDSYGQINSDDALYSAAVLGRTDALQELGQDEAAIEALIGLTKAYPKLMIGYSALGDAYRRKDNFEEAAAAYTKAIDLFEDIKPQYWSAFYTRGIAYERMKDYEKSEADMRKALEISPDQPLVLNYLGYSLVEQGRKLEEAQKMIEKAVELRPDDGYIIDSLGWVYYRLGKFDQAIEPLERAAELMSVDPIVNDHLGDAYWMVGRKREARFQWRRALSFDPEEKEHDRISKKLKLGLDVVLEDEKKATVNDE